MNNYFIKKNNLVIYIYTYMATSKDNIRRELVSAIQSHSRRDEPEYQEYLESITKTSIGELPKKKGMFPFESAQRKKMREAHQKYVNALNQSRIRAGYLKTLAASAPTAEEKEARAVAAKQVKEQSHKIFENAERGLKEYQIEQQQRDAKRRQDPAKKEALQQAREEQNRYNKIQNGYIGSFSGVQTGGKRKTKYSRNNKKHRSKLHTKKGKKRQTYRKTKNKKRNKKKYTTYRR